MLPTPYRIGTTSYILPDDILPNARYLAGKVQDIELVLFEVDDGSNNLPAPEVIAELAGLAGSHDLSYTVHLPLDLRLAEDGSAGDRSLEKARRVIAATRPLAPWAYVLHLDGRAILGETSAAALARWQDRAVRALELAADWAGAPELLAVENLENYPPDLTWPVLERIPASHCVDIGHLWRDGHDPLAYLHATLARTRVIHLHGIGERDHQSLAHMLPTQLDPVLEQLHAWPYRGVLTLEIFGQPDLETSLQALRHSLERHTPDL